MKLINLVWNSQSEEGEIKLSKDFNDCDRVLQLDALSDWIVELQGLYNKILENPIEAEDRL